MSLPAARARVLVGDTVDLSSDPILEGIVRDVAVDLEAPWALLNILLERSVLVRAHHGVPMRLAIVRSMEADTTFCRRVVVEEAIVEVVDALTSVETRLPYEQHGVRSYLGVPLTIDDVCVGALCVADEVPRRYGASARERLLGHALRANGRLAELAARPTLRRGLAAHALRSPFAELGNRLTPLIGQSEAARRALDELVRETKAEDRTASALQQIAAAIDGIEAESTRIRATIASLQTLLVGSGAPTPTQLAHAASELAFHHTKLVGGVRWTSSAVTPTPDVSNGIALAVVASALSLLAIDMNRMGTRNGVDAGLAVEDERLVVTLAADIEVEQLRACAATISDLVHGGKIAVAVDDRVLRIALPLRDQASMP